MHMRVNPKRFKKANELKVKFFNLRDQMVEVLLDLEDELGPLAKPFVEYSVTHFSEFFTIGKPTLELMIEYTLYSNPEGLTINEIVEELSDTGHAIDSESPRDSVYQTVHQSKRIKLINKKGNENVYALRPGKDD